MKIVKITKNKTNMGSHYGICPACGEPKYHKTNCVCEYCGYGVG